MSSIYVVAFCTRFAAPQRKLCVFYRILWSRCFSLSQKLPSEMDQGSILDNTMYPVPLYSSNICLPQDHY